MKLKRKKSVLKMRQTELMLFYEYFLSKITRLENTYDLVIRNMRVKDFKNCDEVDFLDLMLIKRELDFTITIFNDLKGLLKL